MKKILIFAEYPISTLSESFQGSGCTWLPQIADSFSQYNEYEFHWVILNRYIKTNETITSKNQYFHILPYWGLSKSLLTLRLREWIQFRNTITKINPDVIHCWGTENSYAAALFASTKPTILSMQGIISAFWQPGKFTGWRWRLMRWLEPFSIKRATVITCESDWGLNYLHKVYPNIKTAKIEYGANGFFFDVEWQPDFNGPYFVFIGSLDYRKGVDILIAMLEAYPQRNWSVVFVGMGPYYEDLKKLTSHNVEVLGSVAPAHISDILQKASGLVLPTRADTSPNVVKEARVIGLPVISTSNGGQASYIQHGVDGYIIDSEEPHEWYSRLNNLANNPDQVIKFGTCNREMYRVLLQASKTSKEFICLYKKLLEE